MRPQVLLNQVKHFGLVRLGQLNFKSEEMAGLGPLVGPTQQGKMFRLTWRLSSEFGQTNFHTLKTRCTLQISPLVSDYFYGRLSDYGLGVVHSERSYS